jgi:hypothetical protein
MNRYLYLNVSARNDSHVTRVILLNMCDQYMNNFDTSKYARLTRIHIRLTRIKYFSISNF